MWLGIKINNLFSKILWGGWKLIAQNLILKIYVQNGLKNTIKTTSLTLSELLLCDRSLTFCDRSQTPDTCHWYSNINYVMLDCFLIWMNCMDYELSFGILFIHQHTFLTWLYFSTFSIKVYWTQPVFLLFLFYEELNNGLQMTAVFLSKNVSGRFVNSV